MELPTELWGIIYDYKRDMEDLERWQMFWRVLFDNMVEGFDKLFVN